MKTLRLWLLLMVLMVPFVAHRAQGAEIAKKIAAKTAVMAKDLVTWYGIYSISVLAHESAHAITANILYDNPIDITVGRGPEELFRIGPVSFRSFNLFGANMGGSTNMGPSVPTQGLGDATISLAGPLVSILFGIGMQKLFSKDFLLNFLGKAIEIEGYLNLLPISEQTDGGQVCKSLNLNKYVIGVIVSSFMGIRLLQHRAG